MLLLLGIIVSILVLQYLHTKEYASPWYGMVWDLGGLIPYQIPYHTIPRGNFGMVFHWYSLIQLVYLGIYQNYLVYTKITWYILKLLGITWRISESVRQASRSTKISPKSHKIT